MRYVFKRLIWIPKARIQKSVSKKYSKLDGNKFKGKRKVKYTTTMKKEGKKPRFTHYKKKGHDASKCCKILSELNPAKFWNKEHKKILLQKSNIIWDLIMRIKLRWLRQAVKVKILIFVSQRMNLLLMKEKRVTYFIID